MSASCIARWLKHVIKLNDSHIAQESGVFFRQSLGIINAGCQFPRARGEKVIPVLISEIKPEGIK